jgi:SAM-dependent methyltransferase
MNNLSKRDGCRLCNSKDVDLIYKMPECPPVDNFRLVGDTEISFPKFPMDLYMCRTCGHAQLLDIVDPKILYGNYIYTSSSSTDLDRHFSSFAETVTNFFGLHRGCKVLDIGSNDGLLLSKFKSIGLDVVGIDPSIYVSQLAAEKGIDTTVAFFDKQSAGILYAKFGSFELVTANNVFSHADNLKEFAESVFNILSDEGGFVFEVSYLKDLVENLVIDYVYHEHLCHHSIKPLKYFLSECGLRLINVERINTKGGSIRCYAVKLTSRKSAYAIVDKMISEEESAGLYEVSTYQSLQKKMESVSIHLRSILDTIVAEGGTIATYGASATCTVLNSLLKINHHVSLIIDDNILRQNRLSPGFMIPVLTSDALIKHRPTCVVISAWRFAEEIINSNQKYLADGGRFIIPLPEVNLIDE